jgi:hypothetical protein
MRKRSPRKNEDTRPARAAHYFDIKEADHSVSGLAQVWDVEAGPLTGALVLQLMHNGEISCYIERDAK